METTGKLINATRDILTGKLNVTFQIDSDFLDEIDSLFQMDLLRIIAKKFSKKRSLNANKYAWELMSKIANHPSVKSTKEEVYERMLGEYLCYDNEDGYIVISLREDIDVRKVGGHWKAWKRSEDGKFIAYAKLKGSSEYTSSEMQGFINLIVEECKKLHIETLTPRELEEMVNAWQSR